MCFGKSKLIYRSCNYGPQILIKKNIHRTHRVGSASNQRRFNSACPLECHRSISIRICSYYIYIYTNFIQRFTIEFNCLTVASHWSPGCWAPAKPGSRLLEALCRELLNNEACNIQNVPQSINFGSALNQRWGISTLHLLEF